MRSTRFRTLSSYVHICWKTLKIACYERPKAVALYALGAVLEVSAFIVGIYATAQLGALIARYKPGTDSSDIWFWLIVDIVTVLVIGIAFWIMRTAERLVYYRFATWSSVAYQDILSRLDISQFYDTETRNMLNKVESSYSWKPSNLAVAILELLYAVLRFSVTAFVVAQIHWWLLPVVAVFLIPSLLLESRFAQLQWSVWQTKGDAHHTFWGLSWLIRQPTSQMEIRSSQSGPYIAQRIRAIQSEFYGEQERTFSKLNRIMFPNKILENTGTVIGSILLLKQFLSGTLALDRYFFLSGALLRISGSIGSIFGTLGRMQEDLLFMRDFYALMDIQPSISDKLNAKKITRPSPPRIVFEDVSFIYPGHEQPVFEHFNLTIEPGTHIALVGENGAGKSTFIKLLLRFYQPTSGRILINDIDLQDIAIDSWYGQLASLFQEFNKYSFSVRENVEIARPEHAGNARRLANAAKSSSIDSIVRELPHGWDTVLNDSFEKGIEPSGGQWQRVALARAFYRQASVLILDEPTSAIDAKAEYDIFNAIFEHYKNKTAIIISHRFSTVRRADVILVVEHGVIVENGSHKSLMALKGLYYELFSKQAEGYK